MSVTLQIEKTGRWVAFEHSSTLQLVFIIPRAIVVRTTYTAIIRLRATDLHPCAKPRVKVRSCTSGFDSSLRTN